MKKLKVEPRGKYPGVKIHLDKEDCEGILTPSSSALATKPLEFFARVRHFIAEAMKENPKLLEERTEEEIIKELELEAEKSEAKLHAIKKGKDWKKVKVSS